MNDKHIAAIDARLTDLEKYVQVCVLHQQCPADPINVSANGRRQLELLLQRLRSLQDDMRLLAAAVRRKHYTSKPKTKTVSRL